MSGVDIRAALATAREVVEIHARSIEIGYCREIEAELRRSDALRKSMPDVEPVELLGTYPGMEELGGVYCLGHVEPWRFVFSIADFVSGELCPSTFEGGYRANFNALVNDFGKCVIDPMFRLLDAAAAEVDEGWQRLELPGEDGAARRSAPIGSDDVDFMEAGLGWCDVGDMHASPVTACELDFDILQELRDLIAERQRLARLVLRGIDPANTPAARFIADELEAAPCCGGTRASEVHARAKEWGRMHDAIVPNMALSAELARRGMLDRDARGREIVIGYQLRSAATEAAK